MSVKNILVPIDGSYYSMQALMHASDLAEKYNAKLYLLHVRDRDVPAADAYLQDEIIASADKYSKAILDNAASQVSKTIETETAVEIGRVADKILKFAAEHSADIIVIGSRGLGAIEGKIFGSVSQRIIVDAKCCVMVCKKESKLYWQ